MVNIVENVVNFGELNRKFFRRNLFGNHLHLMLEGGYVVSISTSTMGANFRVLMIDLRQEV